MIKFHLSMDKKSRTLRDLKILQAIYFLPTPMRNEIARFAGRSPVSVTETLNRLLELGLVEKSGKSQGHSGRPSATYRLGDRVGYSVGVEVQASGFRLVAIDARHRILRELDRTLSLSRDPSYHLEDIVEQLSAELRGFMENDDLRDRRMLAIGIAPPGIVDTEMGIWLHGLQVSGITHVALRDMMETRFGVDVVIEDASRSLAYLAASSRRPEDARHLVYLFLGGGVGAGIMAGEEPYHGNHGMAGELGHLVVEEEGARCSCGNIGCLETVISSSSILGRFQRRLDEGVISSLQKHRDDHSLSLELIRDAAAAGDRLAQTTLFELGTMLGEAVSKIIKLYNPRTLILGGPVGVLGEHLREPMWTKVRQRVIPEMLVDLTVEIAPSQPRDVAVGTALLAERRFWKEANEESIRPE
jgi:N-acetylglucosamine repressor